MNLLARHVEAIIFASPEPISFERICSGLQALYNTIDETLVRQAIESLVHHYQSDEYSFEIVYVANGYCFMTKPAYQNIMVHVLKQQTNKKLSRAALETLGIIAYKQPISKPEIELIRGVNSDYALKKLLESQLIEIRGKAPTIGKPLLYGTTQKFLEHFGINSLEELPQPKDFSSPNTNEIGTDVPVS